MVAFVIGTVGPRPPSIQLITATVDEISCTLTAPTDPDYDHSVARAYDLSDGTITDLDPANTPSFTLTGLTQNRSFAVIAWAVNIAGEISIPSNIVYAVTNYEAPLPVLPDINITNVTQIGSGTNARVLIEYSASRPEDPLSCFNGDLDLFQYSFSGNFSDAALMTPDFAHTAMSGVTDLAFCPTSLITPPQHTFVWDISRDIPDDTVHSYDVRIRGRLRGVNTAISESTVAIDTTEIKAVVGTVVSGNPFDYSIFLLQGATPLTGAVLTVNTILDPTEVDKLGGAMVLVEDAGVPGKYDGTITPDINDPTGRWQINYSATLGTPPTFTITSAEHFLVVSAATSSYGSLTDPNLCLVYGTLFKLGQGPLSGAAVDAVYVREPSRFDDVGTLTTQVFTDDNGFFILPLRRNADATLIIEQMSYSERISVPDQHAADFRSLQVNQPAVFVRGPFGHTIK